MRSTRASCEIFVQVAPGATRGGVAGPIESTEEEEEDEGDDTTALGRVKSLVYSQIDWVMERVGCSSGEDGTATPAASFFF